MLRRLTVETSYSSDGEPLAENLEMRHLKPPISNPRAAEFPDPELSPFANQDVLTGNAGGPAVDLEIIEKYPTICVVCGVDFKVRSNLHAHLTAHEHLMGKLDNYLKVPIYECKHCVAEVNASTVLRHRCFMKHKEDIEKVEKQMDQVGSPLVCVFCRGRVLPSRSHLIAHLISTHSPHRNPFRCIFCHTKFRSDSLLMQEMHVFDHHVPELEFINRLAYFKAIKTMQGGNVEATTPFLCLYDGRRMEQSRWWETLRAAMKAVTDSGTQGTGKTEAPREMPPVTGFCSQTFNTLAEFTAHLYCQHTFVAQGLDAESVLTDEDLKKLDKALKRIPGPTLRQMMNGPPSGDSAAAAGQGGSKAKKTSQIVIGKSTCKVCLQTYEDESVLKDHWTTYHIPENTKRVQHLIATGELTGILKIDLLCTECFKMFPTVYQLQAQMLKRPGGLQ
uniref:C2H2 type zinc-finger (2 copies) n=1 Tax=Schistocephalus solidus TaxID=70667 RepID=A0A0X3PRA2_SCHSO